MIDLFPPKEVFTINEVSDRLKISVASLRDKVFRNQIPYFKLGPGLRTPVRFYGEQLNQWMAGNENSQDRESNPEVGQNLKTVKRNNAAVKEFSEFLDDLTIDQKRIQ